MARVLSTLTNPSPQTTLTDDNYDYYNDNSQNNGRVRHINDLQYVYDGFNRLWYTATNAGATAMYSYDRWGNIRTMNGTTFNYANNASGAPATNRISSVGSYTYSYDAAGNMTVGEGQTYGYDGANRLKQVDGGVVSYGYDGDGNQVRRADGTSKLYVWSSVLKQAAFEADSSGNVQRAYIYEGKEVVALRSTDGGFYWVHTDHLGSARKLTDVSGNLVYTAYFDPYGQATSEWSASSNTWLNTHKFTGYERDAATGLDYAQARTYNAGRGRFVQPDPYGSGHKGQQPKALGAGDAKNPQSLNRYSYVHNDPLNAVDSEGLNIAPCSDGCCSSGGSTGGGGVVVGGGSGGGSSKSEGKCKVDAISCLSASTKCILAAAGYVGGIAALTTACAGTAGLGCVGSLILHGVLGAAVAAQCAEAFRTCCIAGPGV